MSQICIFRRNVHDVGDWDDGSKQMSRFMLATYDMTSDMTSDMTPDAFQRVST
jgi:hypothetical protein